MDLIISIDFAEILLIISFMFMLLFVLFIFFFFANRKNIFIHVYIFKYKIAMNEIIINLRQTKHNNDLINLRYQIY